MSLRPLLHALPSAPPVPRPLRALASMQLAVGALAVSLAACTVGPDYAPPAAPVPSAFGADDTDTELREAAAPGEAEPVDVEELLAWWERFDDPVLTELVRRSATDNLRVDVALARLEEARAVRRARAGRLRPGVGAYGTAGRSRASLNGPGPLAGLSEAGLAELENEQYTVAFEAGWEIDLFGSVRRGVEASQARLEATAENLRGVLLLVAAEVADAYLDLRGAELRLRLAERNLEIQDSTFGVIDAKVDSGLLPPIDLERTRTERASLEAAIAPLRAQRQAARHRLAVLVGETPGSLDGLLDDPDAGLPEPPGILTTGVPADLLLRRPDLRAAERRLHAATADVGVAVADRFPGLSLGGSLGLESASLGDLLDSASRTWSVGPRIDLPVFQGGRLAAQVEAARNRLDGARAEWRLALLRALEEVESGIVRYEAFREAVASWDLAAGSSRRTSELAGVLYDLGLRDHLVLLDAQRSQTAIEDSLARSRIEVARSAVRLYLALGGGWTELEALRLAAVEEGES